MRFTFTLAILTLLCTCGRAQNRTGNLPLDKVNVAFIKGETGFIIDSLTIRTSLDTFPYGFAFRKDTLILDITIFRPVDELIIETFAQGHSFKRYRCWIDGPSADIHLSVAAGRTRIDSVGLSPADDWFRGEVRKVQLSGNLESVKTNLQLSILNSLDLLMCANFIKAFQELPNLTRSDIIWLQSKLKSDVGAVKRHPWFNPLLARQKVLHGSLPGKLKRYELSDETGETTEVVAPKNQFYILNFYDARKADCRRDHKHLQEAMVLDSIFSGVPVISITQGDYVDGWLNYVSEADFPWPHYMENSSPKKRGLYDRMAYFPASTYVLINDDNRVVGLFDDLAVLASAVLLRKTGD